MVTRSLSSHDMTEPFRIWYHNQRSVQVISLVPPCTVQVGYNFISPNFYLDSKSLLAQLSRNVGNVLKTEKKKT